MATARRSASFFLFFLALAVCSDVFGAKGVFELQVVDAETKAPLSARMHLTNPRGNRQRVRGVPNLDDHFSFTGELRLELAPGRYQFELETGPEYRTRSGYFELKSGDEDNNVLEMSRFVDMAADGWWAGDLFVEREERDLETLMLAEGLHVAVNHAWNNRQNAYEGKPVEDPLATFGTDRAWWRLGGRDERGGGRMIFANLDAPLAVQQAKPEYPPTLSYAAEIKNNRLGHQAIDATAWDLPLWVAHGAVDSVVIAGPELLRKGRAAKPAPGSRPADRLLYPGAQGEARWAQHIYFHLLNCGLRIPPSAASGSGATDNPPGYNRVYVHLDEEFSYEAWWRELAAGRVMVTNGPMIRPLVEGRMPGDVFTAEAGQSLEIEIALNLGTRDKIAYLEVIKNGQVEHEVRLDEYAKNEGRLPKIQFERSGWFLVRAVAEVPETYRFAMTGPYYVQIGDQPRISKASAQFFYDWVFQRAGAIDLKDAGQRDEILELHRQSRNYWRDLFERANAP
ncbi:MAG: CehA/McbA family metallohydrolase [Blastopirellula sp. JB062]